jgi:hypothetical protein
MSKRVNVDTAVNKAKKTRQKQLERNTQERDEYLATFGDEITPELAKLLGESHYMIRDYHKRKGFSMSTMNVTL